MVAAAVLAVSLGGVPLAAQSTAQAQGLSVIGPLSPDHGFPQYAEDKTGTRLEPCLVSPVVAPGVVGGDPCGLTTTIPNGDGTSVFFPENFPAEFFYSRVVSVMNITDAAGVVTGKATFVGGLEGAFATSAAPNQQIMFARLRIWITAGALLPNTTYTAVHPYGTSTFTTNEFGGLKPGQNTNDVGCLGGGIGGLALCVGSTVGTNPLLSNTNIGPFMRMATINPAPAGYLGDPALTGTITGSTFTDATGKAQNYFRVIGPSVNGLPGASKSWETDQFSLWGKLYTGLPLSPGIISDRAEYHQSAFGKKVTLFAHSNSAATVTASVNGAAPVTLNSNGSGRFYAVVDSAAPAGSIVDYTTTIPVNPPVNGVSSLSTTLKATLVDQVAIDAASLSVNGTLTVIARSSDQLTPPVLSAFNVENPAEPLGNLANGILSIAQPVPASSIRITSTNGGSSVVHVNLALSKIQDTVSIVSANPTTSGINTPVRLTVTINTNGSVTPLSGTVTFRYGGTPGTLIGSTSAFAGNTAFIDWTPTATGTYVILADYSGDANYLVATSVAGLTYSVKSTPTMTITGPASGATNTPITLTATVNFPGTLGTGAVTFASNSGAITCGTGSATTTSTAPARITATCVFTPIVSGTNTFTASYAGDATNLAATTATPLSVTVLGNSTTVLTITNATSTSVSSTSATPSMSVNLASGATTYGMTVIANAGTATGNVTFLDGVNIIPSTAITPAGQTVLGTAYTIQLAAGTHTLSAQFAGNATAAASTSATITVTVNGATASSATTITRVVSNTTPVGAAKAWSLSATVAGPTGSTIPQNGTVTLVIRSGAGGNATVTLTPTTTVTAGARTFTGSITLDSTGKSALWARGTTVTVPTATYNPAAGSTFAASTVTPTTPFITVALQ